MFPGMPDFAALERGATDAVTSVQRIENALWMLVSIALLERERTTGMSATHVLAEARAYAADIRSLVESHGIGSNPNALGDHFAYPTPRDSEYEDSLDHMAGMDRRPNPGGD